MKDILYKTDDYVFSYRVAAICVKNGCVLLQKPYNDTGYAFPGGHVEFGETHEETLKREFREEMGAVLTVRELKWVGELFFPWGEKSCQQLCLYYTAEVSGVPDSGEFYGKEKFDGKEFGICFYWIPIKDINDLEIYPTNAKELIQNLSDNVSRFIYRE